MTQLLRHVIRGLIVEGTDSVDDVELEGPRRDGDYFFSLSARHPRLGAVGGVTVLEISPEKPLSPEFAVETQPWDVLTPETWEDFDALRDELRLPDLRVFMVNSSSVSRIFRGEGLGTAMYAKLLRWAADEGGVLVPNRAVEGSSATSLSASRVWDSIERLPGVRMRGDVAWGGGVTEPTLRSRRGHGFEKKSRPRERKFSRDE